MEKTQEEIIYENILMDSKGGFWSRYPYGSGGNVIHWIYTYCNLQLAENITLNDGYISYKGEKIADVEWNDDYQIPIFHWTEYFKEEYLYYVKGQEIFLKKYLNSKNKKDESKI
jgi:hypothetical protein